MIWFPCQTISWGYNMTIIVVALRLPGGAVVKNPPANAGDTDSIPGPGRSHMPRSS